MQTFRFHFLCSFLVNSRLRCFKRYFNGMQIFQILLRTFSTFPKKKRTVWVVNLKQSAKKQHIRRESVIFYLDVCNLIALQSMKSIVLFLPSYRYFFFFFKRRERQRVFRGKSRRKREKPRYAQYACRLWICCSPSMLLHHFLSVLRLYFFIRVIL